MLQDVSKSFPTSDLRTQVCIAGAGAAGISLSLALESQGIEVILLEAGSDHVTPESNDVYRGTCDPPLADSYLTGSRLRYLGGTTNHWLGYCLTLDPIDFEPRDWLPMSGWPLTQEELMPYYRQAAVLCSVPPLPEHDQPLAADSPIGRKPLNVHAVRFGQQHRPGLESSTKIRLMLNASVTQVHVQENGRQVESLEVTGYDGRSFQIRAQCFVLALGGIENARMMLVSNRRQAAGLGNSHDVVGRFFMDHPVFPLAAVAVGDQNRDLVRAELHDGHVFRLSDQEQRQRRLLNCALAFSEVPQVEDTRRQLLRQGPWLRLRQYLESQGHSGRPGATAPENDPQLHFTQFLIRPEQPPLPDNRVTLGAERDAFGNRRAHLHWRLNKSIRDSVAATMELMAHELGRLGLGRLFLDEEGLNRGTFSPGFHHMGTTRMDTSPRRGVVDAQCKAHHLENLYIAGSSVFPTSGIANPTLTLIALALRLADHITPEVS